MLLKKFLMLFMLLTIGKAAFSQATYPKVTTYVGIFHPIVSISGNNTTYNFSDNYTVGMPTGINYWKTPKLGFSFEIIPFIKSNSHTSKMYNLLFHPGILVPLGHGFTFAGRAAFETSGRYGLTPILTKTIIKNKNSSFYISLPFPIRLGNELPTSTGAGVQLGFAF